MSTIEPDDVVHTHPATGVQKGCPECDALMSPFVDGFDIRTNAERERDALAARLASVKALADDIEAWANEKPSILDMIGKRDRTLRPEWVVDRLRAVLGSDAHTEQKGAGQ